MSDVKRYRQWCAASHRHEMMPVDDGEWIFASDYDAVCADRDEMRDYHNSAMITLAEQLGEDIQDEPRFKWVSLALARRLTDDTARIRDLEAQLERTQRDYPASHVMAERIASLEAAVKRVLAGDCVNWPDVLRASLSAKSGGG